MADTVSREKRSEIMSKVRSKSGIENLPDGMRGLYLRKHPRGVFGKPDFGNKTRRIALFIDGCFWHGCPGHYREPKSNVGFWRNKLERNRARDGLVTEKLREEGWKIYRIWEHELERKKRKKGGKRKKQSGS